MTDRVTLRRLGCLGLALASVLLLAGCGGADLSWIARHHRAFKLLERLGVLPLIDRWQVARSLEAVETTASAGTDAADERPDILLVVLDTVRRDRLPVYGYPSDTMPRLSRWARDARVFTEARSTSSWTLPAHASLFTGLFPREHGAHGVAFEPGAPPGPDAAKLPDEIPTLAEALRDDGYATVGIAANKAYLGREMGLARGFDVWLCDAVPASPAYAEADRITDMALEVARRLEDRPLFLFLNYMDAHQPIHVRDGYTRPGVVEELLPPREAWQQQARRLMEQGVPLDPELVASWSEGYDGELRFLDEHLDRLLQGVRAHGIGDGDLLIVLSDHGDAFGEHAIVEHSKHLYSELSRIPLLVRGPGFEPGRDDRPVQVQDVPIWVLEALGLPPLPGSTATDGLQVMELYWTRHKDLVSPLLRARFDRVLRAYVRDGNKRFVDDRGEEMFYDLTRDPAESSPVPDAPWTESLRRESDLWLQKHEPRQAETPHLDANDMEGLRALGYVE